MFLTNNVDDDDDNDDDDDDDDDADDDDDGMFMMTCKLFAERFMLNHCPHDHRWSQNFSYSNFTGCCYINDEDDDQEDDDQEDDDDVIQTWAKVTISLWGLVKSITGKYWVSCSNIHNCLFHTTNNRYLIFVIGTTGGGACVKKFCQA